MSGRVWFSFGESRGPEGDVALMRRRGKGLLVTASVLVVLGGGLAFLSGGLTGLSGSGGGLFTSVASVFLALAALEIAAGLVSLGVARGRSRGHGGRGALAVLGLLLPLVAILVPLGSVVAQREFAWMAFGTSLGFIGIVGGWLCAENWETACRLERAEIPAGAGVSGDVGGAVVAAPPPADSSARRRTVKEVSGAGNGLLAGGLSAGIASVVFGVLLFRFAGADLFDAGSGEGLWVVIMELVLVFALWTVAGALSRRALKGKSEYGSVRACLFGFMVSLPAVAVLPGLGGVLTGSMGWASGVMSVAMGFVGILGAWLCGTSRRGLGVIGQWDGVVGGTRSG
jgi:hypothetical protein